MLALVLLVHAPFVNIAGEAGLAGVPSARAVFADLDGDGRLDVVLDREHVFLQGADGRFAPGPELPFVPGILLFADFDADGDLDGFAGGDDGCALFRNDGSGRFSAEPLDMPRSTVTCACALDYDRDGNLDLFVGSWYREYGKSLDSFPDRLYRGDGEGGFEDVTEAAGLMTRDEAGARDSSRPTYGVTHGDWDGDGWQDLWVCAYGRQWNRLWRNRGDGTFEDVAEKSGFDGDGERSGVYSDEVKRMFQERYGAPREDEPPFRANGNTFDCAIGDFDNDGDMDCILAEITHWWAGPSSDLTSLLVNHGARFERRPDAFPRVREGRWNQGDIHCAWLDFDNDGLLDALIASGDYPDRQELKLYRQRPDHTFEPARTFDWEGAAQISVGDFDADGDLDILCGRSLMRLPAEKARSLGPSCALFRNDLDNGNAWLQVVCRGGGRNRDGIGARIEVTTRDGTTQTREIRGGLGHAGHNDPYVAHFGLGKHETARVEVRWPGGGEPTVVEGVEAGRRIVVSSGP